MITVSLTGCKRKGAIAAIEELRDIVQYDEKIPEQSIVKVSFAGLDITDANLVHVKGLINLDELNLRDTQAGDSGMEHLKGLTSLQRLFLSNTKVTDAGDSELKKALPNCKVHGT